MRPARKRPLFLASFEQKIYHSRRLHARACSSTRGHPVQSQNSMALNRKICKNLLDHSYGVGNAIRRRFSHQHRGGTETLILGCVSFGRFRLLSFVIDRIISNTMTDNEWPMMNDE
jgi:hypothetical protein